MAAATLESSGFDTTTPLAPQDPVVGDRMPEGAMYVGISPDTHPVRTVRSNATFGTV